MDVNVVVMCRIMTGVEYVLHRAIEPVAFVVRKQLRTSPTNVEHLCSYNVVNGTISVAPTLGQVLDSRLVRRSNEY